jgi:hypothetical protein
MTPRAFIVSLLFASTSLTAQTPDWKAIPPDLTVPAVTLGQPAPGKRVQQTSAGWEKTKVHHLLHLPNDWQPGKKHPVIIEYAGNGPYADARGDTCDGSVEGCILGYGIGGGKNVIWASLPFIEEKDGLTQNAPKWWGDVEQTKRYCRETVRDLCARFGGDAQRVFIAGFSRGSIACNFIGLHDDEIAKLWRGFICHSHYDGSRRWPGDGGEAAVLERLKRLGNRPQWISQEVTTAATENWLHSTGLTGDWTFVPMPFPNHSAAWVLRDMPERRRLREWLARVIR